MPLRGRATARNFPKFPNGLRSHIGRLFLGRSYVGRQDMPGPLVLSSFKSL